MRLERTVAARRTMGGARGMTLIEVMLALSMATGIITFVYVSARDVTRTKARIEGDAERLREAQMALDRLSRDLRSAYISGHKKPLQPVVDTVFVGEQDDPVDRVSMTTFTHVHRRYGAKDTDQAEVTWFGLEDPDHPDRVNLARRESPLLDEKPLEGGAVQVLVEDVVDFDVQYYEADRDEWEKEWDTTQATAQPNRLPLQVRIVLTLLDRFGGELTLATQVSLPMTQPILLPGGFQ